MSAFSKLALPDIGAEFFKAVGQVYRCFFFNAKASNSWGINYEAPGSQTNPAGVACGVATFVEYIIVNFCVLLYFWLEQVD